MTLAELGIIDLRGSLPPPRAKTTATGKPQQRRTSTNCLVLHYNGPAAPTRAGGSQSQILGWLREVVIPNHIARIGADGVQYHAWVAADGTIYQLRDWNMALWHCGNLARNNTSIAVHIPIGGLQRPTDVQWQRATALLDALRHEYNIPRSNVYGHLECGASECPGSILMPMLREWRSSSADVVGARIVSVKRGGGTLRAAPNRTSTIIRNLPAGTALTVVEDVSGENVLGSTRWYRVAGNAYIHSSAVE
jgi:hypothetical protein